MRTKGLLDGRQRRTVQTRTVGVGLDIAHESGRAVHIGIAVGPTQFAPGCQAGDGLRRVIVDVVVDRPV